MIFKNGFGSRTNHPDSWSVLPVDTGESFARSTFRSAGDWGIPDPLRTIMAVGLSQVGFSSTGRESPWKMGGQRLSEMCEAQSTGWSIQMILSIEPIETFF